MPAVTRMREILLSHPEVITVVSQHGRPDNGSDASGFFNAEFFVPLKPFDEWAPGMTKEKLVEELQDGVCQGIHRHRPQLLAIYPGQHRGRPVGRQRRQLGQDHRAATSPSSRSSPTLVMHEMDQVRGVADLGIFRVLGQPNLNIKVDREKAARYGLNTGDVNNVVQAALGGTVATTQLEAERQFNVTVRLAPRIPRQSSTRSAASRSATPRRAAPMPTSRSTRSPTSSLDTGASYIFHERNARFIPIKFSVRGRDLGGDGRGGAGADCPQRASCRTDTASNRRASSRSCSRPRHGCKWWCRSA